MLCIPPNHEHINNNNGPKDHHFKAMHPRNINKHIGLTCWPFCRFYRSCNWNHNGNDIRPICEPKYKHWHSWTPSHSLTHSYSWSCNMIGPTWFKFWPCTNQPIPTTSNTSTTPSWVKTSCSGSFHELALSSYFKLVHKTNQLKEKTNDLNNNDFRRQTRLWITTY